MLGLEWKGMRGWMAVWQYITRDAVWLPNRPRITLGVDLLKSISIGGDKFTEQLE
jgi:hypothetical protein